MSEDSKELKVALPYEWALQKTLGPTLEEIGVDLVSLYHSSKTGVANIALAAKKKVKNSKDGSRQQTNMRVTRDVFWNGAFTNEEICAEYFGGALAGSRSEDGKDDSGIYYLDIIKSLSATQLHLHYVIYKAYNDSLRADENHKNVNVGLSDDLNKFKIFFFTEEIRQLGIKPDIDLVALHNKGLIGGYKTEPNIIEHNEQKYSTNVVWVQPTSLGVQLLTVAYAELNSWQTFPTKEFKPFDQISLPDHYSLAQEAIIKIAKEEIDRRNDERK
jgi:hypothetical protein